MKTVNARLIVLSVLLLAAAAFTATASVVETVPIRESFVTFPMQLGEWRGRPLPPFEDDIMAVLDPLEKLRFIRKVRTSSQTFVELTHDYLAERIDAFQASVRRVWPRRQLAARSSRWPPSACGHRRAASR